MKKFVVLILSVIAAFTAAISLTACGKVDFTVKFSVDGETYASVSTGGSEVIKLPDDPQKDGYTFGGWFWDDGVWARPFTANSLLNEPLKSDMTVYAKFIENNVEAEVKSKSLTVSGNEIKGKVPNSQTTFSFINDIDVTNGASYTVYSDIACTQSVPSKTVSLVEGDNVCYILVTDDGEISLYIVTVRRRPIYNVTFNSNGGTEIKSQQVEEDGLVTKPDDPAKTGYDFKGFDCDFNNPIVKDTMINAKWEAVKYKITYVLNGGTNNIDNPTTYTVEDKVDLKLATKTGYTLKWSDNGVIEKGSTGDKTFTANWQVITYKISYVLNGGVNDAENPTTYTIEDKIELRQATKIGYAFTSWNNNGVIDKGSTGDKTFTANWQIITYKISYVLNGGVNDVKNPATYTVEDKIELKPAVSGKSGYSFASWDNSGVIRKGSTGDKTFTANYTADVKLSYDGTTVTGLNNAVSDLVILSEYDGVKVTSIGDSAFRGCNKLTSVTISDSVASIGKGAFSGCSGLQEITIPFIGYEASKTASDKYQYPFGYIFGTDSYNGGVATTQRYYGSYTSSTTLVTYYIPRGLKKVSVTGGNILYGAFYGCRLLESITIDDGVTSIGDSAFYGCSGLQEITIPFVGDKAGKTASDNYQYPFGCIFGTDSYNGGVATEQYYYGSSTSSTTSTTYYIPSSLKKVSVTGGNILYGAFSNCTSLTSITIPDSVTSIGWYAFSGCKSLTDVTIPDSVTSIGYNAFSNCTSLTSIIIPDSVTSIGNDAFCNCTSLASITIPDSVTSISYGTFLHCNSLTKIYYNGDVNNWVQIDGLYYLMGYGSSNKKLYINGELLTEAVINTATMINGGAFSYCTSLTSVTIGDSVASIGGNAFYYCSSLTSITIPDSVTSIEDSAFLNCGSLTSVTIPDSVTSIGSGAFYGCASLTSVTIPDGVTSISDYAFFVCTSLKNITIGSKVTSIEDSAFRDCSSLKTINYKGSKAQWDAISKGYDWNNGAYNYTINYNYVEN